MNSVETVEHIDAIEREGAALAEAAATAGLDRGVPPCPGWSVADLIRHTGYVHRWAARNVIEHPAKAFDEDTEEDILRAGPPDEELLGWFRDGYAALTETLRTADPAVPAPVFLRNTTSPLGFWARRQAHETAIHRADAELAAGQAPAYEKNFAADGIDELIMGFAPRGRRIPAGLRGRSVLVRSTDTGNAWRLAWLADPSTRGTCERLSPADAPAADCVLTGSAEGLYLMLWNRHDPSAAAVTISGETDVAAAWRDFQVRW
jgi:uncharacterized protein (TIGR03083 family)